MMPSPTKQKHSQTRDEHLELLHQVLEELRGLRLTLAHQPKTTNINWDHLPTEDIKLYKPSFVRKLKKSLHELENGKGRIIRSLSDL